MMRNLAELKDREINRQGAKKDKEKPKEANKEEELFPSFLLLAFLAPWRLNFVRVTNHQRVYPPAVDRAPHAAFRRLGACQCVPIATATTAHRPTGPAAGRARCGFR